MHSVVFRVLDLSPPKRIAYYLLETDTEQANRLAHAILDLKQQVHFCPICFNYATDETCEICADTSRDTGRICVVSEPRDVSAIERTDLFTVSITY